MALVLLNTNNGTPYGQFDGYDALTSSMLGGEIATLVGVGLNNADKKAKDIEDGYANSALSPFQRPVVSLAAASSAKPLFLTDDGTANYGTLFGTIVGGTAGQVVSGGTSLGPSTMTGSGKVTLWSQAGLYGVTLDAVDTAADGLVVTNGALGVGTGLTWSPTNGKLTLVGSTAAAGNTTVAARFVEFSTGDTLVTTPRSLTRLSAAGGMLQFKYAVINFNPPVA